jgi:long-chain fatty acid transport protein
MRQFCLHRPIALLSAAGLSLCPIMAHASGFALLEQSASRLGAAFAGTAAAADDATTVFFNPAGLWRLERPEAIVVASGVGITSEFNDEASQAALGQPLGHDGGDAGGWNFVPSAYVAAPLNDKLAIGVGVNAPFGLKTDYEPGWMGRFQALKSEIKTINVNPSLSWRVNDAFSIGVGVSYQRLEAELTNAVNYTAVVAQGVQQLVALGSCRRPLRPA